MSGQRLTVAEMHRVSAWMMANQEMISTLVPVDLAGAIEAQLGITVSSGTAARHRKGLGIVAAKQPRAAKAPRATLLRRIENLEVAVKVLQDLLEK